MRLLQWNVLHDDYIAADFFPLSPPALLRPGARTAAVVDTIVGLEPDVICLVEADAVLRDALAARLVGWDLRLARKTGRDEGCLTGVAPRWRIRSERLVRYADGAPASGHLAQLVEIEHATAATTVTVATTHVRWADVHDPDHIGVRQVAELLDTLTSVPAVAIAADLNDLPGGPVRRLLDRAGYTTAHGLEPTSLFAGDEPRALDVIAVRGLAARAVPTGLVARPPLPGAEVASDHLPLVAELG